MELPKKWCVERTPENCREINRHFSLLYGKQYKGTGRSDMYSSDYMHFPKVVTKRFKLGRVAIQTPKHEVISFETFKNLVLKMKKETTEIKKLIGYKLKFPEYEKAAKKIANTDFLKTENIDFLPDTHTSKIFEEVGLLDIWFEKVYQTVPELPLIQGSTGNKYSGVVQENYVKYGCALLPFAWFEASPNRVINAMNVGDNVFINTEEMTAIRTYLKYHGHVK